jgi:hypothetical protein
VKKNPCIGENFEISLFRYGTSCILPEADFSFTDFVGRRLKYMEEFLADIFYLMPFEIKELPLPKFLMNDLFVIQ